MDDDVMMHSYDSFLATRVNPAVYAARIAAHEAAMIEFADRQRARVIVQTPLVQERAAYDRAFLAHYKAWIRERMPRYRDMQKRLRIRDRTDRQFLLQWRVGNVARRFATSVLGQRP